MASTLLINARPFETRVALLENGVCVEVQVERHRQVSLAGNVYLGRVNRVLPGMQAAFVDIGLPKGAFLYVGDVAVPPDVNQLLPDEGGDQGGRGQGGQRIEELLHEGQEILVQVAKEPLGSKGARVTTHITLPGRSLVYMPTIDHVGVSRRLEDEIERERLRAILLEMRPAGQGLIARTASEGQTADKLKAELDFLLGLWNDIGQRRATAQVPSPLHQEMSVSLRSVRDLVTQDVDHLVIDNLEEYQEVVDFVSRFMPGLLDRVELYKGREPILDAYGVENDLARALGPKIWLKSGGYVVVEKTEALTAVDVNTGRYVGRHNLEETILKTNLEAVKEIAYQLRLRDSGGLIVIDFIDMERPENRLKVVEALKEALLRDRAKTNVLNMSDLGLVEMTRKRVRESLSEILHESCAYCEGAGHYKAGATVCYDLFRALEREADGGRVNNVAVRLHPQVADLLLGEEGQALTEVEQRLGLKVQVASDPSLHLEDFLINSSPQPPRRP